MNRAALKRIALFWLMPLALCGTVRTALAQAYEQMPPLQVNDISTNSSSFNRTFHSYEVMSPGNGSAVTFTGGAQAEFLATHMVHLKSGFTAGDFGSGGFHAGIAPLPYDVTWIEPAQSVGTVPKFEKLELGVKLPQIIQDNITAFLNDPTFPITPTGDQINPYDPDQISVEMHLISPTGIQKTIYGFYYKSFEVIPHYDFQYGLQTDFPEMYPNKAYADLPTEYPWRIRFAPDELGLWNVTVKYYMGPEHTPMPGSPSYSFTCVPSTNKGYLEVGSTQRYLRYSDTHESFFAIGENIAAPFFGYMMGPGIEDQVERYMTELSQSDANYFRVMMLPYQLGVERERLGVYDIGRATGSGQTRLWGGPFYGKVNRQHHAWELDRIIDRAHELNLHVQLMLDNSGIAPINPNAPDDPGWDDMNWSWNPYMLGLGLNGSTPNVFFNDAQAKNYHKRKLRYIVSRWGYSTAISAWELLNEADTQFGCGYLPSGQPTGCNWATNGENGWHSEMANYIRNTLGDQNHLISTSFAGAEFYHPFAGMDFIDVHRYNPAKNANHDRWNELTNIWNAGVNKPAIFGEVGAYLYSGELDKQNPITQHNTMWASAFSGGFGCGLNWWWKDTHDNGGVENYRGLAEFMRGVDFEWNNFRPFKTDLSWSIIPGAFLFIPEANGDLVEDHRTETFYLKSADNTQAMGWVHNRSAYWANVKNLHPIIPDYGNECYYSIDPDNNSSTHNNVDIPCPDDDSDCNDWQNNLYDLTDPIMIQIPELDPNHDYLIQWFNTATGQPIGDPAAQSLLGTAIIPPMPAPATPEATGGLYDWAFKIWPNDQAGFRSVADTDRADTIQLCIDSAQQTLALANDSSNRNIIEISYRPADSPYGTPIGMGALFTRPGWYGISYRSRTDEDGIRELMVNTVECGKNERDAEIMDAVDAWIDESEGTSQLNISVLPNPTYSMIQVSISGMDVRYAANYSVFDAMGRMVYSNAQIPSSKFTLDVSSLSKGVYLLRIEIDNASQNIKIVKE